MDAMVRVDTVSRYFDSSDGERMIALDAVSLDIRRNEFVALVGPSGCGKSTLLRILAGLIKPSAGNVQVAGTPLTGPRERTGIVFQAATLLPWANVLDNILFPVRVSGQSVTPEHLASAHDLIKVAGLQGYRMASEAEIATHLGSQPGFLGPLNPAQPDRKSTRLNSSHCTPSRMPSSA